MSTVSRYQRHSLWIQIQLRRLDNRANRCTVGGLRSGAGTQPWEFDRAGLCSGRPVPKGGPRTLDGLLIGGWDFENSRHEEVIYWLFEIYANESIDPSERWWACNNLQEAVRQFAETIGAEGEGPRAKAPAMYALSQYIGFGKMKPPPRRRGPDPSYNALRNRKMLHIEQRLRKEFGCSKTVAIRVISKTANLKEETVEILLKRTRKLISPNPSKG